MALWLQMQGQLPERPSARISVIEAMRAGAALSIVLFHCSATLTSEIARLFKAFGWLGVDVFFVISGFVIPFSLFGRGYRIGHFPAFMLRRLIRLEPPYLISIALGIALWHLSSLSPAFQGSAPQYSLGQIAAHVGYLIPLTGYSWLSLVYWSLAYEFVFYILVGLLFPFVIGRRVELTVALIVMVGAIVFALSGTVNVYVLEFAIGILTMRVVVAKGDERISLVWLVVAVSVVGVTRGPAMAAVVAGAAAIILFFHRRSLGRWAIFAGSISYSLYLTHVFIGGKVVNLASRLGDGALYEVLVITVATAASIGFAIVFAWMVERPALHASRMVSMRPAAARAASR